jgi:hypothetical protein
MQLLGSWTNTDMSAVTTDRAANKSRKESGGLTRRFKYPAKRRLPIIVDRRTV